MKKLFLSILCYTVVPMLLGQPEFKWVKNIGSLTDESSISDVAGNIYITGWFSGIRDFDPGPAVSNLTAIGSYDIFVLKLDVRGVLLWAKQFGGSLDGAAYSVAVDGSGNVLTTGMFQGSMDFDPGAATFNLSASGNYDIFISKLDATGNFVWAKRIGDLDFDKAYSITTDGAGNIYATGFFSGAPDFDPGAGLFNITSETDDVFILKLDAMGNFGWAKKIGGANFDYAYSISIDASGNIFTTGEFQGTADFDPGTQSFNLTSTGAYDMFVSKLDASGNFIWAKNMGGTLSDRGQSIVSDGTGNTFVTGRFQGTSDFDPGASTLNLTSAGQDDIFILKLNSMGNLDWAKSIGSTTSTSFDRGKDIAVDGSGNVYTIGVFQGTADFDPGAGNFNLSSVGGIDLFISKLNSSGDFIWAANIGGTGNDLATSLTLDPFNNITTIGSFQGTVDFDPGARTSNLLGPGTFLLKLRQSTNSINQTGLYNFSVYPNPTSGILNIEILEPTEEILIEVYNDLGELLFIHENSLQSIIDLNPYTSRIYFIRIMTNGKLGSCIINKLDSDKNSKIRPR
jgi:hypothetical protein